jgi:hypothetical protein
MLCQQAHPSIIFLCCSRAEDSQRFQQRRGETTIFIAVRCTLQQAMQQHGNFAILLFFLIDEMQSRQRKWNVGLVMLSQQPQVSKTLKCIMAALTCKKNLFDCPVSFVIIYG